MNVTVLGSGGWGTALALLLLENGNQVTLWSYFQEESDRLKADRENPMLKGVTLPEELTELISKTIVTLNEMKENFSKNDKI